MYQKEAHVKSPYFSPVCISYLFRFFHHSHRTFTVTTLTFYLGFSSPARGTFDEIPVWRWSGERKIRLPPGKPRGESWLKDERQLFHNIFSSILFAFLFFSYSIIAQKKKN